MFPFPKIQVPLFEDLQASAPPPTPISTQLAHFTPCDGVYEPVISLQSIWHCYRFIADYIKLPSAAKQIPHGPRPKYRLSRLKNGREREKNKQVKKNSRCPFSSTAHHTLYQLRKIKASMSESLFLKEIITVVDISFGLYLLWHRACGIGFRRIWKFNHINNYYQTKLLNTYVNHQVNLRRLAC